MRCEVCGRECDISPCVECWLGLFDDNFEPLPPPRLVVDVDTRGLT